MAIKRESEPEKVVREPEQPVEPAGSKARPETSNPDEKVDLGPSELPADGSQPPGVDAATHVPATGTLAPDDVEPEPEPPAPIPPQAPEIVPPAVPEN